MSDKQLQQVVDDLRPAVEQVWDQIGNDVLAVDCHRLTDFPNAEAVECCIDANRLQLLASAEDQRKLDSAIKTFGYTRVLGAIAERVPLV